MNPKDLARIIDDRIVDQMNKLYLKQYQRGVVSAINGSLASVKIEGNTTAYPNILCIGSYRPKVDDKVLLLSIGSSGSNYVVLGALDNSNLNTWIAPTLVNSWSDYGDIWESSGYLKDSNGMVHLRGLIHNGTYTGGATIFTLPVGFRPSSNSHIPVAHSNGYGVINIFSDGRVACNTLGGNGWLSLAEICFPTH